jgi:DNA-binding Lrp family transcriptional regulator
MESDTSGAGAGRPDPAAAAWEALHDLDDLDRAIVHALQIDGRAAFSRIAEVLGVSDQTVARRYGRLRGSGVLRVLGLVDPLRIGVTPWFVRVRCTPDAAASIGEALARRQDTRWVSLISGGTEIFCLVQPEHPGQDELLLQRLPRTPRVVQVAAHALVHVFFGQDLSPVSRNGPLDAAQAAALTPPDAPKRRPAEAAEPFPLSPVDRRLLDVLADDGRTPAAELAAATGWSASTVRRRMSELRASGALYFDLAFDGDTHAKALRTALWLEVEPARLAEVGAALAEHEEVAFAAATTGSSNVYAAVNCRDPGALYRYLTGPVARLPGIRRTETAPIHRMLKGPGPRYDARRTRSPV